jgi:hypothetical protein
MAIFFLQEPLFCKGGLKALSIIIQGRMGDNLIFADADCLAATGKVNNRLRTVMRDAVNRILFILFPLLE